MGILPAESSSLHPGLDLRAFLTSVKATGELRKISGAHWNLEIGALTELFAERSPTPTPFFDDIAGYAKGNPVLSNVLFSPLRQLLALGVAPELRGISLVQAVKSKFTELKPIPPVETQNALVLENVIDGSDVNVLSFPAVHWHEKDGGRYIGTFDALIARYPDSGYIDRGTYRVQANDEKTFGL